MKKKIYIIVSICAVLISAGVYFSSTSASGPDPGTIQDPLVTKSYIDQKIDELKGSMNNNSGSTQVDMDSILKDIDAYIEIKVDQIDLESDKGTNSDNTNTNESKKFIAILLKPGDQLIASESTEIILRSGSATAIANEAGNGISDITSGADLVTGNTVPWNHLLIVPRTDGRGILIHNEAWVMVKGDYEIQ